MKKIIIDLGRILTNEEIENEAKKQGINTIMMISHSNNYDRDEESTVYEVTGLE